MRWLGATLLVVGVAGLGCSSGPGSGPPKVGQGGAGGTGAGGGSGGSGATGGTGGNGGSGATGGSGGSGGTVDPGPPPTAEWVRRFSGAGSDQAYDAVRGASGEVYVVGGFESSIDLGSGSKQASGSGDAFVVRLGNDGVPAWSKTFGGSGWDDADAVAVDSQGNVIVVGSVSGAIDLGTGPAAFGGDHDVLIAKLSPSGSALWVRELGGTGFDVTGGAVVGAQNAIIVSGSFEGSVNFGGGARTAQGSSDGFVLELSSSGSWVWDYTFGGALGAQDFARDVAVDENGDVYAVGMVGTSAGNFAFSVLKLDGATGTLAWSRPASSDQGSNRAETVAAASGHVFVGGWVGSAIALGSSTITSGDPDPVLLSFATSNGSVDWVRDWHGAGTDHIYGITLLGDNVVIAGRIDQALSFDGAKAKGGCQDALIARVGPDGAPHGAATFGGVGCGDLGRSVAVYDSNRVLVAGELTGSVNVLGTPTTGVADDDDAFVALLAMP